MARKPQLLRALALGALLTVTLACSPKPEERRKSYAREFYAEALKNYREGDYGDALANFEKALAYVEHLTPEEIRKAKYLLVKSAYLDKDYVNAAVYAEDFLATYPGGKEAEEVFFILIDSLVKVAPDPYRDQTYTVKAIKKAEEFLRLYPDSRYAPKVREIVEEAKRKLALHEYYVARFYEEYGYPYNAAVRYREVLLNFPEYFNEEELTYRYIKNLFETPKQVKLEREKLEELINEARKKLKEVRSEEERRAIKNRIKFLLSEVKRWEEIAEKARREALEALKRYKEVFGENEYYRKLLKLKAKWTS
ncbi:MAG: outer membrane protein assembly factor BamD [Aquificae bacterium]|nr:outer membrane protein assembly factor BamD [Aquificota bacterium]